RNAVNKEIETVREAGQVGSSLQATVRITVPAVDHALLSSLGDDLRFVFIVSQVTLLQGETQVIEVVPATAAKCERCWHYREDVGSHTEHPTLCGRCVSNLAEAAGTGTGEIRKVA